MSDLLSPWHAHGFDLAAPFSPQSWNELGLFELPADEGLVAAVVGNTRYLWVYFSDRIAHGSLPAALSGSEPIDTYTEEVFDAWADASGAKVYYAHHLNPAIPIQKIADFAGLASLSPGHLCAHPVYGPWIALRAVVVAPAPTLKLECLRHTPCATCDAPCGPALNRALERSAATRLGVRENSDLWVGVRDVCPVGKVHRYPDFAIDYHYLGGDFPLRDLSEWTHE